MSSPPLEHVWILGPGKLGLALGERLLTDRITARLTFTGRGDEPPTHPLLARSAVVYHPPGYPPDSPVSLILITAPDSAVSAAAELVAAAGVARVPVLHTSGVLGSGILQQLHDGGFPAGSLHPLVPVTAEGAATLRGAWFGVEGDAEAVAMAQAIVRMMGGGALSLEGAGKALYHAASVFASNYVVAVLSVGERLMAQAGIPTEDARQAVASLGAAAVESVRRLGPTAALTGPISRGDTATVELHLAQLSAREARLYSELAREALSLAISRGLDPETALRFEEILQRPAR